MDKDFKKELASLLNNYGWDNACETPDHILADYVERCLQNFCSAMGENIAWHSSWKTLGQESIEAVTKMRCCENCKHYKPCVAVNETIGNDCEDYNNGCNNSVSEPFSTWEAKE